MSEQDKLNIFSKLLEKMREYFLKKFGIDSEQVFVPVPGSISYQLTKLEKISTDDKLSLVDKYLRQEAFTYFDPLFNRGNIIF